MKREKYSPAILAIADMDRDTITPDIAAKALGCNPQSIRVAAAKAPELLGFKVSRIGHRTVIPRLEFLNFMGYAEE